MSAEQARSLIDASMDTQLAAMRHAQAKAADPWAHRSEGMRCRTCMWWVPKGELSTKQLGRCRRHAPTMSGFPAAYEDDWCGDHKLNESIR